MLESEDIPKIVQENLDHMDELFVHILNEMLEASRKAGDLEKSSKLGQISDVIKQASAPPPEIQFIEDLLDAPDDGARQQIMDENKGKITDEFLQILSNLMAQVTDSSQDPELVERLKAVNRQVLRYSMQANLRGG
jgi:hypothetical protein